MRSDWVHWQIVSEVVAKIGNASCHIHDSRPHAGFPEGDPGR